MLSGLRVVDVTDERGQLAGYLLAALGADVIAVEPPGGAPSRRVAPLGRDGTSLAHAAANRGKRSVTVDPARPADRRRLERLLAGADAFLCSGTPAELAASGIDPVAAATANPALVVAVVSPFGSSGPKADWAATDLTVWAAGGPLALSGDADRPPVRISVPQAFQHAAVNAASGVLMALLERDRSGLGQLVDASAQVAAMPFTQSGVLSSAVGAAPLQRSGGGIRSGDVFLRFVYPAADGHVSITLVFGAAVGPSTARLMRYLHDEGWIDEATRDKDWVGYHLDLDAGREPLAGFEALKERLAAFTATRTKAELFEAAQRHRLLIAPVATTADVLASEQLAARGFWEVHDGVRYPGPWARSAVGLAATAAAPEAGVHTAEVDAEIHAGPDVGPGGRPAAGSPEGRTGGLPLAGLKVLDLMWAVAGPTLSRTLADAGATVVRVESATRIDPARVFLPFVDDVAGPERSALFHDLNAGKQSIALDLTRPEGREVALDLVRWADVVCEAYSPRAMVGFGLDYEQLRTVNPSVILLSTCLFGQTGPLALFAGYGNLAGAMTGVYNLTGWPDGEPVGPFGAYTDYTAPPVALTTLLAAVAHQRRTGEGQHLDFSQAEASLHFLAPALLEFEHHGRVAGRRGNADIRFCPHAVFPAAGDDAWVAVVAQDDTAWRALAGLVGRPDLAGLDVGTRHDRREEIEAVVASWTSGRTAGETEARCQALGVAAHVVQNSPEMVGDPQLAHLGHWVPVAHPDLGEVVVEGPRVGLSRTPIGPLAAGPLLGEHGRRFLVDRLGYDPGHVADLVADGVLG